MIGGEFADRVGPLAGYRVLGPFDDMACDVCGAPHAVCTDRTEPQPEPVNVEALVTERAAQQRRRTTTPVETVEAKALATEDIDAAGKPAGPVAAPAAAPAGDPMEVRDLYVVPDGVIDPADDPNRPDPATTVLVGDRTQIYDTGAWMTLPGNGDTVVTTRTVLQVFWPMGTRSPSYSKVAHVGKQLAHPRLVGAYLARPAV